MPFKQPQSVLVVIHTQALDVLLLERAAHPGFWQSVTGSREGDEAAVATAIREVFEETGYRATPEQLHAWPLRNRFEIYPQWRARYAPDVRHNVERVFALECAARFTPRLAPDEHRAAVWCDWQSAADRVFSWTNRDAILQLGLRGPGEA